MQIFHFLKISLLFGLVFYISACNNDNKDQPVPDQTKPTITLLSPTTEHKTVEVGKSIDFSIKFEDDVTLSQAKVLFHYNDGHTHKALPMDTAFVLALTGREETRNINLPIAQNVSAGLYFLEVICLDGSGNQSDYMVIDVEIISPDQPDFSELKLDQTPLTEKETTFIDLNGGKNITKQLTAVIKGKAINQLVIAMHLSGNESHKNTHGSFKETLTFPSTPVYNLDYTLPFESQEFEKGEHKYDLYLNAQDANGHTKVLIFPLKISNN